MSDVTIDDIRALPPHVILALMIEFEAEQKRAEGFFEAQYMEDAITKGTCAWCGAVKEES